MARPAIKSSPFNPIGPHNPPPHLSSTMTRSTFLLSCLLGLLASDGVVALRPKSASIGPPRFGRKSTNEVDVIASTPPPALCPHTGCKCSPMMSAKIVLSAALETCLLYAIVNLAVKVNTVDLPCNPKPDGISFCLDGYDARRHIQAILIVSIIFAAAFFGNIIDSGLSAGLSAATRQILGELYFFVLGWIYL